jgi:hypothetical protein
MKHLWILGSFNGLDGLSGLDTSSNAIVSSVNTADLCGTSGLIRFAGLSPMPPKTSGGPGARAFEAHGQDET